MQARRSAKGAKAADDASALKLARAKDHAAKVGLGARGDVWWDDGSPGYNQRSVSQTPYVEWFASLAPQGRGERISG